MCIRDRNTIASSVRPTEAERSKPIFLKDCVREGTIPMDDLRHRKAPLDIAPEEFRAMGHQLVDRIANHFETLASRRLTSGETAAVLQKLIGANQPVPVDGSE